MTYEKLGTVVVTLLLAVSGLGATQQVSLPDAIARAKEDNPSIQAGVWRARQQQSEVAVARSELLPEIVASGDYTLYEKPNLVTPMRDPRSPPPLDDEIYGASLRVRAPLLDLVAFSKLDAARRSVEMETLRGEQIEQHVFASIAEIFVQSEQVDASRELLDSHIEALQQRREEIRLLSEEGRVSPADVAVVDAAIDSAESDRLELLGNKESLAIRLGSLLGEDASTYPGKTRFDVFGVDGSTEGAGPALAIASAQVEAAEASKSASRLAFAPQLDAFAAQIARSGSDLDFETEWSLGLQLTVPLFSGGERMARMRSADAGLEGARSALQAARDAQTSALRVAETEWNSAKERRALIQGAIEHKKESVSATERRYEEGRASLSDLLSEEAELLEFQFEERRLLYTQVLSLISYHETTGELSESFFEGLIKE